jgi:sterol desaturase/sphingolipid hydroxylase (fatty acid hydroxylase superfamily)
MSFVYGLLAAAVSFLILAAIFLPLERAYPAKAQKVVRPLWRVDLAFFLGQYLLWNGLVLLAMGWSSGFFHSLVSAEFRALVRGQPFWLQALQVVVLSDFLIYWGHRLQHRIPLLWRFHAVHHSAEHLDWLAAHREHPLDSVYTIGLINLPAFILGFPLETLAAFTAFRGLWAIYIHSNVQLPLGPLRVVIGAPELHHWHHARDRFAGNYANLSPLMDWIFGTYKHPGGEPDSLGLREEFPRSYLGQLAHPFSPKFGKRRANRTQPEPPADSDHSRLMKGSRRESPAE